MVDDAPDSLPSVPLTQLIPGLPPQYDYEAGIDCALEGQPYRAIAKAMGISQVQNLVKLRHAFPLMSDIIARARNLGLDVIFDDSRFVVEDYSATMNSKDIRTKWESIKWYLGCADPKKYGERMQLEITEHVDLRGAMEKATSRVITVLASQPQTDVLGQKTSTSDAQPTDT